MGREKRREPRYDVVLDARVRNGSGVPRSVRVTNLSQRGCRFRLSERRLGAGSFLTITVERVGFLDAHVKWREGDWHGIRFDQPLHPAVLDHIRLFLSKIPALHEEGPEASLPGLDGTAPA
jgi:hypothetical protein